MIDHDELRRLEREERDAEYRLQSLITWIVFALVSGCVLGFVFSLLP